MNKSPEEKDSYIRELENRVAELENRIKNIKTDKNPYGFYDDSFSYMVKNSNDMFVIIDQNGEELFVSDSVKKITGFSKEETIGHKGFEFLHPDDFPQITEALTYLLQNPGKSAKAEYRHRHKNGGYVHLEALGTNYIDVPNINGIVMNVRDITERKAMEKALKDSVELFSKAFYDHPVAMQIVDIRTGERRDVNKSCIELFDVEVEGFSKGNIYTENIFSDSERQKEFIAEIEKNGFVNDFPMELENNLGEIKQVLISSYKLDIGDGNLIISSFVDVTAKNSALKLLKESEEKFRTLVTNTEEIVYMIDRNGRFILSEGKGLSKINLKPGEVVGINVFELYKEYPEVLEKIRLAFAGETLVSEEKVQGIYFRNWYTPHINDKGEIIGVLGLSIDITEQKNTEEQLLHTQKMESIGRLAGGVAHDFNNMLSVILGYTDLALKNKKDPDVLENYLREIHKAASHSAELTRQLLAFARKETISPRNLNFNKIVSGMTKMLRRTIGEEIEFNFEENNDLWNVFMDPAQVDQILINLCINSKDAIDGVGKISFELDNVSIDEEFCRNNKDCYGGEFVLLKITDTGTGIDEEFIDKIFEPFFTTKKKSDGTGLGLSMVYGIVKQNKGFIKVTSEPGTGSCFEIYVPRYINGDAGIEVSEARKFEGGGDETVLVVEDEEMILELVQEMLECYGYNVLTANAPETALIIAENYSDKIDILLSDIVMPEMNGQDLALKILQFHSELKVLFMSGYTSNIIEENEFFDKERNFLQKPFEEEKLNMKIREILDC